jgi:hypothetical protein
MGNLADSNLDDYSPDERAAIEDDLREQLRIYFRHLVGIAGAYEHIEANGNHKPQKPFYFSSAVLQIRDQWFLATAGHNVKMIDAAVTRSDMRLVACGLDDTYAPESDHKVPIEYFDYANALRFHRSEDGLDFGLVHLRKNYRDLLAANGIQPLSEKHWAQPEVDRSDTFLMVGFPKDSVDSGITFGAKEYNASVKGRPSVILIDRQMDLPHDIPKAQHDRFVGQIHAEHDVGSIVGMSGGPIFCFTGHNFEPYYIAAIQSTWYPKRRMTFGCPIPVVLDVANDFISSIRE